MANIITAGMTGTQFLSAINNITYFNVLHYGAVGDDATNCTTAIQNAINAAHVAGGTVYFPAGTYKTNTLTSYTDVRLTGDGYNSVIKSRAAEPLINIQSADWITFLRIDHLMLNGDNTGTIGLNTLRIDTFSIDSIVVVGFVTYGIYLLGGLIGQFSNCKINFNAIGVFANESSAPNHSSPNHVSFYNVSFMDNPTYALKWTGGLMTIILECDFERNGTNGNVNTGVIYYKGGNGTVNKSNVALSVKNCWIEANNGTLINLDEPAATIKQLSIIENTLFIVNTPEIEIKVLGATTENKLVLRSSTLQHTAGLIIDGASASVINDFSEIPGTITKSNSGTYFTTDVTSA